MFIHSMFTRMNYKVGLELENLASWLVSTERPPLRAVGVRRRCRRQLGEVFFNVFNVFHLGEVGDGEGGNLGVLLLQPARGIIGSFCFQL